MFMSISIQFHPTTIGKVMLKIKLKGNDHVIGIE